MTKTDNSKRVAFSVSLLLHGDFLDPDEVTRILKTTSSKKWRKGDVHITSTGQKVVRRTGLWSLSAESESDEISEQIEALLKSFPVENNLFEFLPNLEYARISVFYSVGTNESGGGGMEFRISNDLWVVIANLGVSVEFSLNVIEP